MKKLFNNSIFTFIIGVVLTSVVAIYAYSYNAKDISFTPSNTSWKVSSVKDAIDSIKNTNDTTITSLNNQISSLTSDVESLTKTPTQVAELKTQNASYTMQNDGYILGTAAQNDGWNATIYFDDQPYGGCPNDSSVPFNISLYVTKGTVVKTRSGHGIYNLTVYEWK